MIPDICSTRSPKHMTRKWQGKACLGEQSQIRHNPFASQVIKGPLSQGPYAILLRWCSRTSGIFVSTTSTVGHSRTMCYIISKIHMCTKTCWKANVRICDIYVASNTFLVHIMEIQKYTTCIYLKPLSPLSSQQDWNILGMFLLCIEKVTQCVVCPQKSHGGVLRTVSNGQAFHWFFGGPSPNTEKLHIDRYGHLVVI